MNFGWVTSGWPYADDRNAFSLYLLYIYSQHLSKLVVPLLFMPLLLPPVWYFPEANLKLCSTFPIAASLREPPRALCRISLEKVKPPWTAQLCSNCCCNKSKCLKRCKSFVFFIFAIEVNRFEPQHRVILTQHKIITQNNTNNDLISISFCQILFQNGLRKC